MFIKREIYALCVGFLIFLLILSGCGKKKDNGQVLITTPLGDNITDDTLENLETFNPQPSIPEITETDVPEIDSDTAMRMYQAKLESSTDEDLILELAKITGSPDFVILSLYKFQEGVITLEEFISIVPELKGMDISSLKYEWDGKSIYIKGKTGSGDRLSYVSGVVVAYDSMYNYFKFDRDLVYVENFNDEKLVADLGNKTYLLSSSYYLDMMQYNFVDLCYYKISESQKVPGFYDRIFKEVNGKIKVDVSGLLFLRDAKYNLDLILQNNTLSIDKKVDSIYDGIFCSDLYTDAEKINLAGNAISYFDNIEKNSDYKTYQVNGKTLLGWAQSLQVQSISEIEAAKAKDMAIIQAARESYVPVG